MVVQLCHILIQNGTLAWFFATDFSSMALSFSADLVRDETEPWMGLNRVCVAELDG